MPDDGLERSDTSGIASIEGGVWHPRIGSPLDRPYLHYTYNFIVFLPMVIALWDEARRVDRLASGRSQAATGGA